MRASVYITTNVPSYSETTEHLFLSHRSLMYYAPSQAMLLGRHSAETENRKNQSNEDTTNCLVHILVWTFFGVSRTWRSTKNEPKGLRKAMVIILSSCRRDVLRVAIISTKLGAFLGLRLPKCYVHDAIAKREF